MNDIELIQRAIDGCVIGDGRKQIELLIAELKRIVDEVRYVRSLSYCPNMGEFSKGYATACNEILSRIATGEKIEVGKITIESLAKRLSEVEQWIKRREIYESEQREQ